MNVVKEIDEANKSSISCPAYSLSGFRKVEWQDWRYLLDLIADDVNYSKTQRLSVKSLQNILLVIHRLLYEMCYRLSERRTIHYMIIWLLRMINKSDRMCLIQDTEGFHVYIRDFDSPIDAVFPKHATRTIYLMPIVHKAVKYNLQAIVSAITEEFAADLNSLAIWTIDFDDPLDDPTMHVSVPNVPSPFELEKDEFHFVPPIWIASIYGYPEMMDFLVKLGANIDCRSRRGCTGLIVAAYINQWQACLKLITLNANVSLYDKKGGSALINSVHNPYLVHMILNMEKHIDHVDENLKSAIFYAAQHNNVDSFRELAKKGADLTLRDKNNDTLIRVCALHRANEVFHYIHNEPSVSQHFTNEQICEGYELCGVMENAAWDGMSGQTWKVTAFYGLSLHFRALYECVKKVERRKLHYLSIKEFENEEELNDLHHDTTKIFIQSVIVAERILGRQHPAFLNLINNLSRKLLLRRDLAGIYLSMHAVRCFSDKCGLFCYENERLLTSLTEYFLLRMFANQHEIWYIDEISNGIDDLICLYGPLLNKALLEMNSQWNGKWIAFMIGKNLFRGKSESESILLSYISIYVLLLELYLKKTESHELLGLGVNSFIDIHNKHHPIQYTAYMEARIQYLIKYGCLGKILKTLYATPWISACFLENTLLQYEINIGSRGNKRGSAVLFLLLVQLRARNKSMMNKFFAETVTIHTAAKALSVLREARYLQILLESGDHSDAINTHGQTAYDIVKTAEFNEEERIAVEEKEKVLIQLRNRSIRLECIAARCLGKMLFQGAQRPPNEKKEAETQFLSYIDTSLPNPQVQLIVIQKILLHSAARPLLSHPRLKSNIFVSTNSIDVFLARQKQLNSANKWVCDDTATWKWEERVEQAPNEEDYQAVLLE